MSQIALCNCTNNENINNSNNNDNTSEDSSRLPTIYRCRAPIASLDCMEEFSAGSTLSALAEQQRNDPPLSSSGGGSGGGGLTITKEQLLTGGGAGLGSGIGGGGGVSFLNYQQIMSGGVVSSSLRQGNVTPGLRYRNLGKSGLRVSNIGLGTWTNFTTSTTTTTTSGGTTTTNANDTTTTTTTTTITEEQEITEQIISLAVECGINLFDLSEAHSGTRAEVELGRILAKKGWKRTCFIVTTKIYWSTRSEERGLSRKHIIESIKASLQRLQLAYIDIVIIHKADAMCPMEEIVRAMHYAITQGWIMYWGTARWSPVEIMEAYTNCRQFNCVTPIVEQAEYHMFCRDKCELYMPELYHKIGVGLIAWSPISMGLNGGGSGGGRGDEMGSGGGGTSGFFSRASFRNKYASLSWTEDETSGTHTKESYNWSKDIIQQPDEVKRQQERVRELSTLAERLGCTLSQLSIAWCLKNESVQCLLIGANSVLELYDSIQSLQLVPKLNSTIVAEIERILANKPTRPPMVSTLALR